MNPYYLVLKTGQSEMRAFREVKSKLSEGVFPVVEITRGRKNLKGRIETTGETYNFSAVVSFIDELGGATETAYIDITKEESLSSEITIGLESSDNGYQRWVQFVLDRRDKNGSICPVLQISPKENESWGDYISAVHSQFDAFAQTCDSIMYRARKNHDNSFDVDIDELSQKIERYTHDGGRFVFLLDYDYIRVQTSDFHAVEAVDIIRLIHDICPSAEIVLVATSFPSSVTDVGEDLSGDIPLEEVFFHSKVSNQLNNVVNVKYGDYASVNPIRNDFITQGWIPRIDFPYGGRSILYFRERRRSVGVGKQKRYLTTYSQHYPNVATRIVADPRFGNDLIAQNAKSWGIEKIVETANGTVAGSSPSFWISVRMVIHIEQQLDRV